MKTVHIIAVAYKKYGELRVFVQSWLNQSNRNWILSVIHDGHDDEFVEIMKYFAAIEPDKIAYQCTDIRFNDYGHSLREIGLHSARGDYVLLTNADNYYIPKALEFINAAILEHQSSNVDVFMFDMVHSHSKPGRTKLPAYSIFEVSYQSGLIDIGAAIVTTDLAKKAGFANKSFEGDAHYFKSIAIAKEKNARGEKLTILKIPRVLLVHN
tara:strand:+ start:257 stop:889 length:633 start_codon:yes stop_codon:yes gene_type:complete